MPIDICMLLHKPADNDSRVIREAQALQENGYNVLILSISPLHTKDQLREVEGIPVKDVSVQATWLDNLLDRFILKGMTYLLSLLRFLPVKWLGLRTSRLWGKHYRVMLDTIKMTNAVVYHANDYHTLALAFIAFDNPTVVYDVHDLEFDRVRDPMPAIANRLIDQKHAFERSIEQVFARRCADIIAVSEASAEFLEKQWSIEDVKVIRNLVDPPYDKQPEITYPAHSEYTVVHVGNLNLGRQLDVLVDAFQYLPDDVSLVLMGHGTEMDKLQQQADTLTLGKRFHIVPPVSPNFVAATASQAHLSAVLNPGVALNREYTYPQKLFESIAAGLPVVTGQTQSVKYLVERYELGVLVDVYDPKSVADGIMQILQPKVYQQYCQNVEKARAALNWQNEKQRLIDVYQAILS